MVVGEPTRVLYSLLEEEEKQMEGLYVCPPSLELSVIFCHGGLQRDVGLDRTEWEKSSLGEFPSMKRSCVGFYLDNLSLHGVLFTILLCRSCMTSLREHIETV